VAPGVVSGPQVALPASPFARTRLRANGVAAAVRLAYLIGRLRAWPSVGNVLQVRCQDRAQEALPAGKEPSDSDIRRAQELVVSCMDGCANEFSGGVPKLRANIEAGLKKIPKV
jgi:hypothetical protein